MATEQRRQWVEMPGDVHLFVVNERVVAEIKRHPAYHGMWLGKYAAIFTTLGRAKQDAEEQFDNFSALLGLFKKEGESRDAPSD